ncbi:MAG: hypothetical protein DRJ38_03640 [Thermoprotei archaeon]|nr:MAG: hypothetical protein DRJ38_03640 [Thermoprotei archaeon]
MNCEKIKNAIIVLDWMLNQLKEIMMNFENKDFRDVLHRAYHESIYGEWTLPEIVEKLCDIRRKIDILRMMVMAYAWKEKCLVTKE